MESPYPNPAAGQVLPAPNFFTTLTEKLASMRFWTFSLLLHVVLVVLIGGTVLMERAVDPPDFAPEGGDFVSNDPQQAAPPPPSVQIQNTAPTANPTQSVSTAVSPSQLVAITTTGQSQVALNASPMAAAPSPTVTVNTNAAPPPSLSPNGLSKSQMAGIAGFTGAWAKGGKGSGNLKERSFQFTAYLAKYADGDWDSTVRLEPPVLPTGQIQPGSKIVEGSLPNLLFVLKRLSRDKVAGEPQAEPLDLASEEIFQKKPPFIFFTGHRDFHLTDKEVANLRNYIILGGCVWGDSSLAGHRSRFDIAFRREMKRVIADVDKDWKELPANHPLFTKCYFQEVKTPPPGINFYHEPVWGLVGVGGEIGVIYTSNDYGDMFQFGIDEKGNIDTSRDEKLRMIAVNEAMWWRRNLYFRNIEPHALLNSYKFGMNIVIHLMTRWEDKLGIQPKM